MSSVHLRVTDLAQYLGLRNCDRFLWFRLHPAQRQELSETLSVVESPISPLLSQRGYWVEAEVAAKTRQQFPNFIDCQQQEIDPYLVQCQQDTVLSQVKLSGRLGQINYAGVADLIHLQPAPQNRLRIMVADIKSSRQERNSHRLQVAIYAKLLQQTAESVGRPIDQIKGSILHLQENDVLPQLEPDQPSFNLTDYNQTLRQLVTSPNSITQRLAASQLDQVAFEIGPWCDQCVYNALCAVNSFQQRDLSLIPHLNLWQKRTLQNVGLKTPSQVANLTEYQDSRLVARQPDTVDRLRQHRSINQDLDLVVQRAKKVTSSFDQTIESRPYLLTPHFGYLPNRDEYPDLIQVFLDAQQDYILDRLYLLAAGVRGPRLKSDWAQMSPLGNHNNKDSQSTVSLAKAASLGEKELLNGLIQFLLKQMPVTPVQLHFYFYDRYTYSLLCNALVRYQDSQPAQQLLDLISQTVAINQQMVSYLDQELKDRQNLGRLCPSLYQTAEAMQFNWKGYKQLFQTAIFDTRRDQVIDQRQVEMDGKIGFSSQIPIEYAYIARKNVQLIAVEPTEQQRLDQFPSILPIQLEFFAKQRIAALHHLEQQFTQTNKRIQKTEIDFVNFLNQAPNYSLQSSLQEYLLLEYQSNKESVAQIYQQPVDDRVLAGHSLRLRYLVDPDSDDIAMLIDQDAVFQIVINQHQIEAGNLILKEGDWVVLNPVNTNASQLEHGRLAVIEKLEIEACRVALGWRGASKNRFQPWHRQDGLQPNQDYIIDPMTDDINANKACLAIEQAQSNTLHTWLTVNRPDQQLTFHPSETDTFLGWIDQVESDKRLTNRQIEVVTNNQKLLLVQGPPGTGKSYTLAWALLHRLYQAWQQGRSCAVAVACFTHSASRVVLNQLADRCRALSKLIPDFPSIPIYKIGDSDQSQELTDQVQTFDPYQVDGGNTLPNLLADNRLIIFGGTSAGFYNLARSATTGKQPNWEKKYFDLLAIDEASQMSLPYALLSAAWLKPEGEMIVVGDPRQMPPIHKHNWQKELRPTAIYQQPYHSLFEALQERGLAPIGLDRSFRLHRTVAQFLAQQVYLKDGINFYSERTEVIPAIKTNDAYLQAVMNPDHPLVVVEHQEQESEQYNPMEIQLLTPIIEACRDQLNLNAESGIGVVVPHRAQRAELRRQFPQLSTAIDTVERFQGGQREVVIVSATASDPDYVQQESEFILNLNRLNVALSRAEKKLIVIASTSLGQLLTNDIETLPNIDFWQQLFSGYAKTPLWQGRKNEVSVSVRTGMVEAINPRPGD